VIDDDAEEFTTGDGTTETEVVVVCPHCGETNELGLDPGGGPLQEYVEDCQVCCRPWRVTVRYAQDGSAEVSPSRSTAEALAAVPISLPSRTASPPRAS